MVLLVVGAAIIAVGFHFWNRNAVPQNATEIEGVVVDVSEKQSSLNRAQTLYGPAVRYVDPTSGETMTLAPQSHGPRRYEIGERITVIYKPDSGTAMVPLEQPMLQRALPFVAGLVIMGLGLADLMT